MNILEFFKLIKNTSTLFLNVVEVRVDSIIFQNDLEYLQMCCFIVSVLTKCDFAGSTSNVSCLD